jgi:CRISPR-associated endonuclease/helicase Cas3
LLDTAAVAELVWDQFLAPAVRDAVDVATSGHGRGLYVLLCGLHDIGKATPAFQVKAPLLAEVVHATGLTWPQLTDRAAREWHHTLAGAVILRTLSVDGGWPGTVCRWLWPLIAGHHGRVPAQRRLKVPGRGIPHGIGVAWAAAQQAVADRVATELGVDLSLPTAIGTPPRAVQLALLGAIMMADWIASDDAHFPGLPLLTEISMPAARTRAAGAWSRLGLRGGWSPTVLAAPSEPDLIARRFGRAARPIQAAAVGVAERMPGPGLVICEAPMGEGKTEAALAVAEVLARRFGADGVFVGMPTQATSDPMYARVRQWTRAIDAAVPVALLHGKARFNPEWAALRTQVRLTGVCDDDAYGVPDPYGTPDPYGAPDPYGGGETADERPPVPAGPPAQWLLGRHRGLLAPVAVGTVDQVLFAGTRTRFVMLRHTGLAGRVVVLDEVHAFDVYMAQFLFEVLRWLGDARVPVVLLSATLPPPLRSALVRAYLQGVEQHRDIDLAALPQPGGYPSITAAAADDRGPWFATEVSRPWRQSLPVRIEVLAEDGRFGPDAIVAAVTAAVGTGGCALVVCNTVGRAQAVYQALAEPFGADRRLLHARLTAARRAEVTGEVVAALAADRRRGAGRPDRLVVVATQLAEQSFDVDADLLVTDLAPIDLLLQRAGRLHRHDRPASDRPAAVAAPRVLVSGLRLPPGGTPSWPVGSGRVYGDHALIRAAALVAEVTAAGAAGRWSVPADVPTLVARGYSAEPLGPPRWAEAADAARERHEKDQATRAHTAAQFLLRGEERLVEDDPDGLTLDGLHERDADLSDDDETVATTVRDGDPSIEVVLVVADGARGFTTLAGRPLGPNGAAVSNDEVLEEVLGGTVRLPAWHDLTTAVLQELQPLGGWSVDPWLAKTRALPLARRADGELSYPLGRYLLRYDDELGLQA